MTQIALEVLKDKSITDLRIFHDRMKERGVKVKPLWDSKLSDNPNLKTFLYERDGYSFVGSKIGKDYTPKGLATIFKEQQKLKAQQRKGPKMRRQL